MLGASRVAVAEVGLAAARKTGTTGRLRPAGRGVLEVLEEWLVVEMVAREGRGWRDRTGLLLEAAEAGVGRAVRLLEAVAPGLMD